MLLSAQGAVSALLLVVGEPPRGVRLSELDERLIELLRELVLAAEDGRLTSGCGEPKEVRENERGRFDVEVGVEGREEDTVTVTVVLVQAGRERGYEQRVFGGGGVDRLSAFLIRLW